MNFKEAISAGIERKFDFKGRSSRSEYWWWALFITLVNIVLSVIANFLEMSGMPGIIQAIFGIFTLVFALGLIIPSLAVGFRRFHDIDRSAWWCLIALIPIIGSFIVFFWMIKKGTEGPNRFGPDPLG